MCAASVFVPYLLDGLPKTFRFFELLPRSNDLEDEGAHLMSLWMPAPDRTQFLRCRAIEGRKDKVRHGAKKHCMDIQCTPR